MPDPDLTYDSLAEAALKGKANNLKDLLKSGKIYFDGKELDMKADFQFDDSMYETKYVELPKPNRIDMEALLRDMAYDRETYGFERYRGANSYAAVINDATDYAGPEYKTYYDTDSSMAPRIARECNQYIPDVLTQLKRARQQGWRQVHFEVYPPVRQQPPVDEWDALFRSFTYKPNFYFTYMKVTSDESQVRCLMYVENTYSPGDWVPVEAYRRVPSWENEEAGMLWIRDHLCMGMEQHEMDEAIQFNGKRIFDPHDDANKSLQIIR